MGALHVGNFLWAFIYQQADEMNLGIIRSDRLADLLQDGRLACFGRRDDQTALTLADRRNDIDSTSGNGIATMLHL